MHFPHAFFEVNPNSSSASFADQSVNAEQSLPSIFRTGVLVLVCFASSAPTLLFNSIVFPSTIATNLLTPSAIWDQATTQSAFEDMAFVFDCQASLPPQVDRGNEIVCLIVGKEEKKFTVHKALLCAASDFFEAAFDGGFEEGRSQQLKLPEQSPDVFAFFLDWLYSGLSLSTKWPLVTSEHDYDRASLCILLHAMSDCLMIPGLQLSALHCFSTLYYASKPTRLNNAVISRSYHSDTHPVFRRFLVNHVITWLPRLAEKQAWNEIFSKHAPFSADVLTELATSLKSETEPNQPRSWTEFLIEHGIKVPDLIKEARKNDRPEKSVTPMKLMKLAEGDGEACLGVKRKASTSAPATTTSSKRHGFG